jgi:hypothetical protein
MFEKFIIDNNISFEDLLKSADFEEITKGRKGTTIVGNSNFIPLVRTTTKYEKRPTKFTEQHYEIIQSIRNKTKNNNLQFNNALIEIYDNTYCSMGYHSDQAQDLEDDSYICLFSIYDKPTDLRKLEIKNKITSEKSNIILDNNSIILFSVETNKKYLHRIILDKFTDNNLWLGITFRMSKTFIYFINEIPFFSKNNKELRLANEIEKKQFYKYRSLENTTTDFIYPELDYTISKGDL